MKVRVSMMGNSMTADLPEEKAVSVFRKTIELMCIEGAHVILAGPESSGKSKALETVAANDVEPEEAEPEEPEPVMDEETEDEDLEDDEREKEPLLEIKRYKGFMYIKCPKCGAVKGFCMKKPSDHYHCDSCGERTEFTEPLVPLWVFCECGKRYKYWTNMSEPAFDVNCFECGNPIAVQWNVKEKLYEPMR